MNKERKNQLQRLRIIENKKFVRAFKVSYGRCRRCRKSYHPEVMQFHHVFFPKVGNVSDLVCDGYSLETIKEEISKCELICANCHAYQNAMEREGAESSEAA